jgi:hypothetical protein
MIVEGAVGMVEMALEKLSDNKIVELDEERKAAMVSNLLVVLCGNKDAQPIVNSGSLIFCLSLLKVIDFREITFFPGWLAAACPAAFPADERLSTDSTAVVAA